MLELIKRITRYYWFEFILAIITIYIAIIFVYDSDALISALARKTGVWGGGLVLYYIARFVKVGRIEWESPYDKIYAITILLYTAIIFAFA